MMGSYSPSSGAGRSSSSSGSTIVVEPARFSSYLRTRVFGQETLDIGRIILDRRTALEQHATYVGSQQKTRNVLGNNGLFGTKWTAMGGQVKAAFNEFMQKVSALSGSSGGGGVVPEEEVNAIATEVYRILRSWSLGESKITPKTLSLKLKSLLHEASDADIRTLAELVNVLYKYQEQQNKNTSEDRSPKKSSKVPTEYGAQIQVSHEGIGVQIRQFLGTDADEAARDPLVQFNEIESQYFEEEPAPSLGTFARGYPGTLEWLRSSCELLFVNKNMGSQEGFKEIVLGICRALSQGRLLSDDLLASELLDMIGYEAIELVREIIENRTELVKKFDASVSEVQEAHNQQAAAMQASSVQSQVTVQTGGDKMRQKLQRKQEKWVAKMQGTGPIDSKVLEEVFEKMAVADDLQKKKDEFRDQFGMADFGSTWSSVKKLLPPGSTRKNEDGYLEISVPPAKEAKDKEAFKLVKVSDLDELFQATFQGFSTLNRIQSEIYPTAYKSNCNILVCAPTGAGKTNIAMITILREIGLNTKLGSIQKDVFKIVYVAPMKALASEVTATFSRRLQPLQVTVRELTGDMQLSKKELSETQMIVTTPEKWDVITRKSNDNNFASLVRLLIIDEVHLLNDDRGSVIETIVARTLRQVESSQSMIRIVGLSATLPNYKDVADFLKVHREGLFFFDATFRPVPLEQTYIGVTPKTVAHQKAVMNDITSTKSINSVRKGNQVLVFVHARNETVKTARALIELAQQSGELDIFSPDSVASSDTRKAVLMREASKSRSREVRELVEKGFGCHHAGMLRSDRNLMEKLFAEGLVKLLVCTATLAWGVNLPAHTVIIKGTKLYDPQKGSFVELSMLDVMQMFGRAGRPQFDTRGEAIIVTTHDKLDHYMRLLTSALPIESRLSANLIDNLNAEIVLGTVANIREASLWLSYTYLHVRMAKNPLSYGINWDDVQRDPTLSIKRQELIRSAARELDKLKMIRFDQRGGNLYTTELGRIASHFYLKHATMEMVNEHMNDHMSDVEILNLISQSSEFQNIRVREDEIIELEKLKHSACMYEVKSGIDSPHTKVNILIQAYISRVFIESFSLTADSNYIAQNIGRICRAFFELSVRRGTPSLAANWLKFAIAAERRVWPESNPLRQFDDVLSPEILLKLENHSLSLHRFHDLTTQELGAIARHPKMGTKIRACIDSFPEIEISATIHPITRTVLQIVLRVSPKFAFKERYHGGSVRWHIWVEDQDNEHLYHTEIMTINRKDCEANVPIRVTFTGAYVTLANLSLEIEMTVPIFEPIPPQYYIRALCDSWLQAETVAELSFKDLILPAAYPPHTELLDLRPLPRTALNNPLFEALYTNKFTHFNPIQTQIFHTMYHTDMNVLLGAPTGSGKTISSELAMLRVFTSYPERKVIYIAPLKALVRERIEDWSRHLCSLLGKKMVELTGDYTPDIKSLLSADIIISTPEKWDSISRNWKNRAYVQRVALVVIDEIHLLGGDRGPILEVLVSRMRYIAASTNQAVRFVGLSTALANARDLADWLGIKEQGLFNFKPSVRPVPLEVHIQGYPGKFYCPRMATMNKPAYAAIMTHSPIKPVIVFVSSRRQTRLTALDLIAYAAADERPRQYLHVDDDEMEVTLATVRDANLKHTLQFGIGLHHAGLHEGDRKLVERLFGETKIQILVSTSTLAWGINLPAHLVVIKGTEYFDGSTKRYIDYPITDVLQMMGRAGRPQFDTNGKAVVMVHEPKKSFYKKFLYEPFPVESSLPEALYEHFNAEIVAGTITRKQIPARMGNDQLVQNDVCVAVGEFLLANNSVERRILKNPSYYHLEGVDNEDINLFLSGLVENTISVLEDSGCISIEGDILQPTALGQVASFFYLKHSTAARFKSELGPTMETSDVLQVLCMSTEYEELPVRHNEDQLNWTLANRVKFNVNKNSLDDPHTKANLLLQAHFGRVHLPVSDYITDTKMVLDNSIRLLQAMIDICAGNGWLHTTLQVMNIMKQVIQARWVDEDSLLMLPGCDASAVQQLNSLSVSSLLQLVKMEPQKAHGVLQSALQDRETCNSAIKALARLPLMEMTCKFVGKMKTTSQEKSVHTIMVSLKRLKQGKRASNENDVVRAFTPYFPKVKEECWWIVVGSMANDNLLAMKRISANTLRKTTIDIPARFSGQCTVFLISDTYIGLDQNIGIQVPQLEPHDPAPEHGISENLHQCNKNHSAGENEADEEGKVTSGDEDDLKEEGFWD